jgi:hypothetical protein
MGTWVLSDHDSSAAPHTTHRLLKDKRTPEEIVASFG